jgi:hypothetical protein
VAQVGALVRMSRRIARAQVNTKAFGGDLAQVSLNTVLTIVGLERRTGIFETTSPDGRASIEVVSGYAAEGHIGKEPAPPAAVLRAMMEQKRGRFSFNARPERAVPEGSPMLRELLIEVARHIDESARGGLPKGSGDIQGT